MLRAIRNLDYVILLCQDLGRMRAFDHDTLGFPIYRELEGWIEPRVGAALLTLRGRGRPYDRVKAGEHAGVQLAFRVLHSFASYATFPPTIVFSTFVSGMEPSGQVRMSRSMMIRSASLPTSRLPFSFSSWFR